MSRPGTDDAPGDLAARLDRLRGRRDDPGRGWGAVAWRADLDGLVAEAEDDGRSDLAAALRRLGLLAEVAECLEAQSPSAGEDVVAFCDSALRELARALLEGRGEEPEAARILHESARRWESYLDLLDPGGTGAPCERGEGPADEAASDRDMPAIDASVLLRLLAGDPGRATGPTDAPTPRTRGLADCRDGPADDYSVDDRYSEPVRPSRPISDVADPISAPALHHDLDLDPELREAFLADASDLRERMESLLLSIDGTDDLEEAIRELSRCLHTLKGAAGSVGLAELSAVVHGLEDCLDPDDGPASADWIDLSHDVLTYFEGVLAALNQRRLVPPAPEALRARLHRRPVSPPPVEAAPPGPRVAVADPEEADRIAPTAPEAVADGTVRLSCGRLEELMDLAAELVGRRGAWVARAEAMKQIAAAGRPARSRLLDGVDRLRDLADAVAPGSDELTSGITRLAERSDDLAALADAAGGLAGPLADDADALAGIAGRLWDCLQAIHVAPVRGLFHRLARVARQAGTAVGRPVEVVLIGEGAELDRAVQEKAFEPMMHVVRNAVGHGIEPSPERLRAGKPVQGRVTLEARREGPTLALSVADDGRGLDYQAIAAKARRQGLLAPGEEPTREQLQAMIFRSGFSTREEADSLSGRGVGMDVVAREVARLHGTVALRSQPGLGTTLTVRLPARLALENTLVVRIAGRPFAIPLAAVARVGAAGPGEPDGGPDVPTCDARRALGLADAAPLERPRLVVVQADGCELGLRVGAIDGPRELVVRPLGPLLAGHPAISGTSLSPTGELVPVLDPFGLVTRRGAVAIAATTAAPAAPATELVGRALVVDDALSVRRVVRRHLRALGVEVDEAADGIEGLRLARATAYRLIVSDLEMPRMDGFTMLAELGRGGASASTPVVVVSTLSDERTRRRVLELGASALLAKPVRPDALAAAVLPLLGRLGGKATPPRSGTIVSS